MKRIVPIFLIFLILSQYTFGSDWLLRIEGKTYTKSVFINDYKIFLKMNYPNVNIDKYIKNKKLVKRYFYSNFLVKKILNRFAKNEYLKRRPKMKKAFNRILYLNAISQYVQYYHVNRFMKEPTEAKLKKLHQMMIKRKMLKAKFRNRPFNKLKPVIKKYYYQAQKQGLLMKFIQKVQSENRIIYNDDLEQDLLRKYVEGNYSKAQIQRAGNKLWLLKFNNYVLSMSEVENDVENFLYVNNTAKDRRKYKTNAKYRKKFRRVFLDTFMNVYFLSFYARKKGYVKNKKHKKFIDFIYNTQLTQSFVAKKFKPQAKKPTNEEIKIFYKKYKKAYFKKATLAQAKDFIVNRIMFQKLQKYQQYLYNRLRGRYKFKINSNLLK